MTPKLLALPLLVIASSASAQLFDWSRLSGTWAESTRNLYGCRPDNLHHAFVVSDDKKTLTFKLDRLWKIGTGAEVREYKATIVAQSEWSLIIRYGSELEGLTNEMREWELRFIGPGTYRWRSTAWAPHEFNSVVGVRCE
jgi:hypothetical protein